MIKKSKFKSKATTLIITTFVLITILAFSRSRTESTDTDNSRIAFVVFSDEGSFIYTMSPDGSNKTKLTSGNSPCWSPDGSKIAFSAEVDGNEDIYYMNADGSNITRLTIDPTSDGGPTWSPDGSMIAFNSDRSGSPQIWRTNVDAGEWGYNLTKLTEDTPHNRVNNFISWSPNGLWIAFEADRDRDDPEIYLANAVDGTNQQRLTYTRALDEVPCWTPDSKQIVFSSDMHGEPQFGNYDIYIMNIDGSDQKRLTKTNGAASNPSVSPDGKRIVHDFATGREGKGTLFVINVDGSNAISLGEGSDPAWSPFLK